MTVSSGITWRWRVALRRKAFSFFFSKDSCQKALGTKKTSSSVSFDSSCYWLSLVTLYGSGCTLARSVGNQFAECIIIVALIPITSRLQKPKYPTCHSRHDHRQRDHPPRPRLRPRAGESFEQSSLFTAGSTSSSVSNCLG
jgi:hypothetical protein